MCVLIPEKSRRPCGDGGCGWCENDLLHSQTSAARAKRPFAEEEVIPPSLKQLSSSFLVVGVAASQDQDFGTANLHLEVSDVVSVLVYVGVAKGNGVLSKTGESAILGCVGEHAHVLGGQADSLMKGYTGLAEGSDVWFTFSLNPSPTAELILSHSRKLVHGNAALRRCNHSRVEFNIL